MKSEMQILRFYLVGQIYQPQMLLESGNSSLKWGKIVVYCGEIIDECNSYLPAILVCFLSLKMSFISTYHFFSYILYIIILQKHFDTLKNVRVFAYEWENIILNLDKDKYTLVIKSSKAHNKIILTKSQDYHKQFFKSYY